MKENSINRALPLESHPLGVISCIPYSTFWLRSVPSNARCTESQKGRKVLISLFSLNFFGNHFNFFRVLIKEHANDFFFTFFFFLQMFIQIKLDTLENQRIWLENTNLGNPSGQSSLPRYLAWLSSSVLCLTLSYASQQRWGPLGDSLWGTRCVPSPEHLTGKRKGRDWGLVWSMEMQLSFSNLSASNAFSEPGPWVAGTTSPGPSWPKSQCFCENAVMMFHATPAEIFLNFHSRRKGTWLDSFGFCSSLHYQGISQAKWFSLWGHIIAQWLYK